MIIGDFGFVYSEKSMRIQFLFFVFLVCTASSFGSVLSPAAGGINYAAFFPSDIHQHPIIFEKFEKITKLDKAPFLAFGPGCSFRDIEPEKVNALIQKFIDTHTNFQHQIVPTEEIDSLSTNTFKYVVKTKLMEFETQASSNSSAVPHSRVFKSVFYLIDRMTGKEYFPFHSPRKSAPTSSEDDLPDFPPKDKQFFKALSSYMAQLSGE